MRLAILAGGDGWHVRDFRRAAEGLGHSVDSVDFRRLRANVEDRRDKPGGSLAGFDAVIVRTMPPGSLEQVVFRMDLLHRAISAGVVVLNSPVALETCVDKYLATARLAAAGLSVPRTVVCQHTDAALEAFESLGRDVVVKPLFGSEGRGMVRVSDAELAWRAFRTLERMQSVIYLQEFLTHPGWDLRVLVLGRRVLGAMRRHARDDWRTNVAQGGRAEAVTPTADEERLALQAAAAVGADFAGVDLLPTKGGYVVLEVNAVPGWRALAPACGVDVPAAVVRHLALGRENG
jgi:ribosomal protein S6--L-glutamate ligase